MELTKRVQYEPSESWYLELEPSFLQSQFKIGKFLEVGMVASRAVYMFIFERRATSFSLIPLAKSYYFATL